MKSPFAITLGVGSSLANRTGNWRIERPVFVDRRPPCNDGCPPGENIQRWLYHASAGDFHETWNQIVADNPFPATSGRVCDRPCEQVCHRARMDGAVGVGGIEAFVGDQALAEKWDFPDVPEADGPPVLVIGSGPLGLAAAYHLRMMGHPVTLRDPADRAGGRLRAETDQGRLPAEVLDGEISRVLALGMALELGTPTEGPPPLGPGSEYAAVVVAQPGIDWPPRPGVFVDGEAGHQGRSIVSEFGEGKKVAHSVHTWMCDSPGIASHRLESARFEHLNTWYYEDAPATPAAGSGEMLDEAQALYEARRCLSCGGCFECDNCFSVCPDNAVVKLGPGLRYEFDLDYCKGCGICVTECPAGAIRMEPETL